MKPLVSVIAYMVSITTTYAGATATVFSGNLGPPEYFSGTNCRIWGDVVVTGPPTSGFVAGRVFVNGILAYEFENEPGIITMQHASISMRFDSTYFPTGNDLLVRVEFKDEDGLWHQSQTEEIVVVNSLLLAQHSDSIFSPLPVSFVADLVEAPSFSQSWLEPSWTPIDFCTALGGVSVVFVSSHGSSTNFMADKIWLDGQDQYHTYVYPDGEPTYIVGHPEWLQSVGVLPYRPPNSAFPGPGQHRIYRLTTQQATLRSPWLSS